MTGGRVLDWVLSGNRADSVIGCCNQFYLEVRRNDTGEVLVVQEAVVTCISQDSGLSGHVCGLDSIIIFV